MASLSSENIGLNQRVIEILRKHSGQAPEVFVARELKVPDSAVHDIVTALVRKQVLKRLEGDDENIVELLKE